MTRSDIRKEFAKATTGEDVKAIYKKLALKYHPDREGGDVEIMKIVNVLFDEFYEKMKHIHKTREGKTYEKATNETPAAFREIIDKLMKMPGVTVEIIGCFIWVGGDTKPNKDTIKSMGFKWHSKKMLWYKAPEGYKKATRKKYTIDEIRNMFGTSGTMYSEAEEPTSLPA